MIYETIETISFTNAQGKTVPIKDMREYEKYNTKVIVKIRPMDELDEIASRKEVYGDEGELNTYKLYEANIIELFENHFSLENIEAIKVPI